METGPLNFVTLSRRDFNNQRVKPDENLYFVHEQYVDDKGEVKTKIVLYKGKIPIGLVDKGRDGLSVFHTALSLGDERVVVEQSDIMTDGRALQVGDMFIDDSAENWLYQVTATPGTQAHAERIAPVRGDKGDKGDTGLTPEIAVSASVDDAVGTPSVSVTKSGTDENPTFGFAFHNLKGEKGDKGDTGLTPDIAVSASVDDAVGTPSVAVTKGGTPENPTFGFAFHNLKGNKGDKGERGLDGIAGISIICAGHCSRYSGEWQKGFNNYGSFTIEENSTTTCTILYSTTSNVRHFPIVTGGNYNIVRVAHAAYANGYGKLLVKTEPITSERTEEFDFMILGIQK